MARQHRMTPEIVEDIKRLRNEGASMKDTADKLGISFTSARKYAPKETSAIVMENKEQSYRENLAWAMNAIGEFLRTHRNPITCPNNAAWFMYVQAQDEPKDFLAKVSAVEKSADDSDKSKDIRQGCRKTLSEIQLFLDKLREDNANKAQADTASKKAIQKGEENTGYSDAMRPLPRPA
jgi:gas vesicle protein